ncbi:MAG: hypothetical protein ACP5SD_08450 [Elusimicrobiales bacterium]|jgi:hypothetical protein|nr:hypothetical protein [Elusimicrobiales bacterium]HPO95548.1 hypothetical protein [Elusimicrobiales bacterium]
MLKEIIIKEGMPTLEEARKLLLEIIDREKKAGTKAFILIHGYGSTGVGGVLKIGLRKSLNLRKKEGKIFSFYPCENWSILKKECQEIEKICPSVTNDRNLLIRNPGATLVILAK